MTITEPARRQGGPQYVGNIGMYFAAYRLSLMGWNVMPTSRNARGIDLLGLQLHRRPLPRHSGQGPVKTQPPPCRSANPSTRSWGTGGSSSPTSRPTQCASS